MCLWLPFLHLKQTEVEIKTNENSQIFLHRLTGSASTQKLIHYILHSTLISLCTYVDTTWPAPRTFTHIHLQQDVTSLCLYNSGDLLKTSVAQDKESKLTLLFCAFVYLQQCNLTSTLSTPLPPTVFTLSFLLFFTIHFLLPTLCHMALVAWCIFTLSQTKAEYCLIYQYHQHIQIMKNCRWWSLWWWWGNCWNKQRNSRKAVIYSPML